MNVLIIDDAPGGAGVAEKLTRAGRRTLSCRAEDPNQLCRGVEPTGRCPLDEQVDVAVAPFPLAELDEHGLALGYVCARRAGIPIVAIGDGTTCDDDPSAPVLVHDLHDIAAVVAGVASRPVEPHTAAARRAMRSSLDRHGASDVDASAWVERRDGALQVRLTTSGCLPTPVAHAASVRALAAVRAVDPDARTIGVSVIAGPQ